MQLQNQLNATYRWAGKRGFAAVDAGTAGCVWLTEGMAPLLPAMVPAAAPAALEISSLIWVADWLAGWLVVLLLSQYESTGRLAGIWRHFCTQLYGLLP